MTIELSDSGIQIVATDASTLTDSCWAFERGGGDRVVRFMRGAKMENAEGVFDQFSAALQFPYYFGENWPAFSECMLDLSWLPASHYLLVILDAAKVLSGSDSDLSALVRVMRDCYEKWPLGFDLDQPWARKAAKFHLILQTDIAHADALTLRWAAAERR